MTLWLVVGDPNRKYQSHILVKINILIIMLSASSLNPICNCNTSHSISIEESWCNSSSSKKK